MKIKCAYCGAFISDTDEQCPNCGAANENLMRSAEDVPKTIDELIAFCGEKGLPLEQMRFFIGADYKQPKAFGIYKDADGTFVVYKNKADGTRAVRYHGRDEAYAVNEIYQKIKSEILARKTADAASGTYTPAGQPVTETAAKKKKSFFRTPLGIYLLGLLFCAVVLMIYIPLRDARDPKTGYYNYHSTYYYFGNNDRWYRYDASLEDWYIAQTVDSELEKHYNDYYKGLSYYSSYDASDFSDSSYYKEASRSGGGSYNSTEWDRGWDDDDDWSYDYGGWDYNDSDWDSDW